MIRHPSRRAFSLLELLVVVVVVAVLIGLLIPAAVRVRADADQTRCAGHLGKLGQALHEYEGVHGKLPPRTSSVPTGQFGWVPYLLPYLGHEDAAKRWRWEEAWNGPNNLKVTEEVRLKGLECPATPGKRNSAGTENGVEFTAVWSIDYSVTAGLSAGAGKITGVATEDRLGVFNEGRFIHLSEVSDGLATTAAATESAGKPFNWVLDKNLGLQKNSFRGIWSRGHSVPVSGHHAPVKEPYPVDLARPGPCVIGCTNGEAVYSFHADGANHLMLDGSVWFVRRNVNYFAYFGLYTIRGGEVVNENDF